MAHAKEGIFSPLSHSYLPPLEIAQIRRETFLPASILISSIRSI